MTATRAFRVESVEGYPVRGHVTGRVLARIDAVLVLELRFRAGAASDLHRHDHESVCYVASGRLRTRVAGRVSELGPGEACSHPPGVDHAMEAIEDSVVLEVKSPAPDLARVFGPRGG